MIKLYSGSGSSSLERLELAMSPQEWLEVRRTAVALLAKRGHKRAAGLLETCGFEVYNGTNDFKDEFCILYRTVALDDYIRFESYSTAPDDKVAFTEIAKTVTELGPFIRFIVVELKTKADPQPVSSPTPTVDSTVVERALIDAEQLIHSSGAVSAIDRAHTALHGYLRAVCVKANLISADNRQCGLNEALKYIREKHPKFTTTGPHAEESTKILKAMGAVTDTLGTLRNHASVAHPNQTLLDEPEAMLAINASRTLLHFIHSKLEQ